MTHSSRLLRAMTVFVAACSAGVLLAVPSMASADASRVTVRPSDFHTDPTTTGGWLVDDYGGANHAVVTVASPAVGSTSQLLMHLPHATDRAILHYRYAVSELHESTSADDFASLRALLEDASYTFSTANVNFQVGIFFTPVDPTFGPNGVGTNKCSLATSYDPDWCFTTIKYQPFTVPSALTTVDISSTFDEGYVSSDHAGWWRSQRVGTYAKPGAPDNVSFEDMLDQMSSLIVYGVGVSIGTAATDDVTAWVSDFSFGGTTYSFAPNAAAPAPFADGSALQGAAVPAATVTSDASAGGNRDLTKARTDTPLLGEIEWTNSDTFVDVYAYSSPVFIGTFPVVGGRVQFSANISGLASGSHTLLFIGQQSSTQRAAPFTVTVTGLAATGDSGATLGAVGIALLGLGALVTAVSAARRRESAAPRG